MLTEVLLSENGSANKFANLLIVKKAELIITIMGMANGLGMCRATIGAWTSYLLFCIVFHFFLNIFIKIIFVDL